jgi:hypothetical protein
VLNIVTFLWGTRYSEGYLDKLVAGISRHLAQPVRFMCVTERERQIEMPPGVERHAIKDPDLCKVKGCFARLRLFDAAWQARRGIAPGERIVGIDLDTVITGSLDPLFDRPEPFVIMQGGNAANPCPYNGALMLLSAGAHPEVWSDFSLEAASKIPFHSFPDDQGWIANKVPGAAGWKCGAESGVYVYQKPGWPGGKAETRLPAGARLVTFINRDPSKLTHLDWVKQNWIA